MTLTAAERSELEGLLGPITSGEELGQDQDLKARIDRLGGLPQAALEVVMARLAEFSANSASISGGRSSSNHAANITALRIQAQSIAAAIESDPRITSLTDEATVLLGRAASLGVEAAAVSTYGHPNRRPV